MVSRAPKTRCASQKLTDCLQSTGTGHTGPTSSFWGQLGYFHHDDSSPHGNEPVPGTWTTALDGTGAAVFPAHCLRRSVPQKHDYRGGRVGGRHPHFTDGIPPASRERERCGQTGATLIRENETMDESASAIWRHVGGTWGQFHPHCTLARQSFQAARECRKSIVQIVLMLKSQME